MRYLSLFSGIEACTVAWKPLGWECVAVAEIEPFPCAVLAHHYPNVPNLGDVTKITEQQIKELGQIDLVVFGSPCQNLSVAGNRKGLQGESSGLFYEAIRLISYAKKHCGARFALWENVPGSFSSNKGDDFREVVRELSANRDINTPANGWGNTGVALGENGLVEWRVLDAQYFGLAQRRKRVFAIVDFGNWMDRPPILLEPKSLCGNTPPSREKGQETAIDSQTGIGRTDSNNRIVGALCARDYKGVGNQYVSEGKLVVEKQAIQKVYGLNSQQPPARLTEEYCDTLVASNYKEPMGVFCVHGTQDPIISETTANCLGRNSGQENVVTYQKPVFFAEPRRARGVDIVGFFEPCPTLQAYAGTGGGNTPMVAHKAISVAGNIIGRSPQNGGNGDGFDEEVCYTLTTADRHAVAANSIIRRLTPTECEILQGFPRNYTKIPYRKKPADQCPDSPRYKALGNSMAVPVMAWIGKQIQKAVAYV